MPLEFVTHDEARSTMNVLLYGPPGVGKTTGGLSAPGPILYLNAEGPNASMYARRIAPADHILEVEVDGVNVLNEATLYVRENGDLRTVVLDSLGAVHKVVLEDYADGGKPTLPQYGDTTTAIERFCRELRNRPVNFVVLAHEFPVVNEETGAIERLPYSGTKNPALGQNLMRDVDIVGYCGRTDPSDEHPEPRYVAQLFNGGGRHGKNRGGYLPDAPEINIADWVNTWSGATTPAPREKETVAS